MGVNNKDISALIEVMRRLRDPQSGCPWDRAQDFNTIAPYTIEEAYEVADAIARNEMADLRDELGDLLLQVVFHAQMAEERDEFAFADVVAAIVDKMVRRHPHIFADAVVTDAKAQSLAWEEIDELETEIDAGATRERVLEELGDVLFSMVNIARHLELDPEGALISANARFVGRFSRVCEQAGGAQQLKTHSLDELEAFWQQAKRDLGHDGNQ